MPRGGFSGSLRSPKIDVVIDMGNPFLNRTVDGFLKIGAVGACKVAAEETFECLHRGACVRPPLPRPFHSYSVSVMLHSIAHAQEPLLDGKKSFDFASRMCVSDIDTILPPKRLVTAVSLPLQVNPESETRGADITQTIKAWISHI